MIKGKLNEGHIARNASMNVETSFAKKWMQKGNAKPIGESELSDYGVDPEELKLYGCDIEANTKRYNTLCQNAKNFASSSDRDFGKIIYSWTYECPEEFKNVWVEGNKLPIRNKLGYAIAHELFLATDGLNDFGDTDIIAEVIYDGIMHGKYGDDVTYCMESVSAIGDAMFNCIEYVVEHAKDEFVPVNDESRAMGIYEKKEGATAKRFFNKDKNAKRVCEDRKINHKHCELNESKTRKINEAAYNPSNEKSEIIKFIKKVIKETPVLKAEYDKLMALSDEEAEGYYDSYKVDIFQKIFRDYNTDSDGKEAISFNPEKRIWTFYIPIVIGKHGCGLSWDERSELEKKVKSMAEEKWPTAQVRTWDSAAYWNDCPVINVSIYLGNKSSTGKRLAMTAIKKFIGDRTPIQVIDFKDVIDFDHYKKEEVDNKLYIFEKNSRYSDMKEFDTLSYFICEPEKDTRREKTTTKFCIQFNGNSKEFYVDADDRDVDSDSILKDINDYYFPKNDDRDNY